ncbi:hypothetical protein Tco_0257216 [Tanacetum coccineum]
MDSSLTVLDHDTRALTPPVAGTYRSIDSERNELSDAPPLAVPARSQERVKSNKMSDWTIALDYECDKDGGSGSYRLDEGLDRQSIYSTLEEMLTNHGRVSKGVYQDRYDVIGCSSWMTKSITHSLLCLRTSMVRFWKANYLGELVRELSLHYPSWRQMPPERKAGVVAKIGIYNGKNAALKERHWVPDKDGTYDVEHIRREHPSHIYEVDWDAQIAFWNDPKNLARAA